MGFAHSDTFADMYDEINLSTIALVGFIPEANRKEVANIIFDKAGDLDTDDWDGSTDLEKDGGINQDLDT